MLHHDEDGFLEAMRLLVDSGKVNSAADLIRYAESAKEANAAEFLRPLVDEGMPVDLIVESLSTHLRQTAWRRNRSLLASCEGKQVGLVMPLPPHVMSTFLGLPKVAVLVPDGHKIPAALRGKAKAEHKGSRAGRKVVSDMEVLVFEAHRAKVKFSIDASVADIVDLRIIPRSTPLIVHLRPHSHPDDQPLDVAHHTLHLL